MQRSERMNLCRARSAVVDSSAQDALYNGGGQVQWHAALHARQAQRGDARTAAARGRRHTSWRARSTEQARAAGRERASPGVGVSAHWASVSGWR